jgi:hypothetical protein
MIKENLETFNNFFRGYFKILKDNLGTLIIALVGGIIVLLFWGLIFGMFINSI